MYSDDENQTPSGAELAYYLALIGMLGVVGFYCVELARLEYFGIDDWWLLHEVRQPGFSWTESFLPFEGRRHWAFRPIGEQAFYRIAYQAFGLEASGYFNFFLLCVMVAVPGMLLLLAVAPWSENEPSQQPGQAPGIDSPSSR